ncbi:glycosyltransferase family 4 protein [Bosea sp. BH3]|uniref:glycosyltransferase family 4 protein n=1 Tax=Bosea sp. BH3 TaxID=2871701 RepID=UPI0021CB010D|nr:glycosyltransferase family 4 protein [Bosea sp. BH3]MCU4178293.1 glycosyltransferase family 4 protein [Bosea sp. BH3]
MHIAFHTPLNQFDDGGVSGDRRMARQLVTALESLGHSVEPVRSERGYLRSADAETLSRHQQEAARLGEELLAGYRTGSRPRPNLWFTYHNYYRAPDLVGPGIAEALGIPYVTAEASDAEKRATGEWAIHTAIVRRGLAAGDVHFYFTDRDREGLEPWRKEGTALLELPPFITIEDDLPRRRGHAGSPRLITIAMMREGAKLKSYLHLARVLDRIRQEDWHLTIIGDGSQRGAVEAAFATLPPERIAWLGQMERKRALEQLADHDVFVWPGVREAYGMVYLEAQAVGLPVVAFDSGGISAIVKAGETALLCPESDEAAFAEAVTALLRDQLRRERMGEAARRFVLGERSTSSAAAHLASGLAIACRHRSNKLKAAAGRAAS